MQNLHYGLQFSLKEKFGFSSLSPIQLSALAAFKKDIKEDVFVCGPTGTGKSLAYLLPLINSLLSDSNFSDRSCGTVGIILTPTRELSVQLCDVLIRLLNFTAKSTEGHAGRWIVPGTLLSGISRNKEKSRLRKGITIIVSTPGRLIDHLENTSSWTLKHFQWLVVEEADRYLADKALLASVDRIFNLLGTRGCSRDFWRLFLVSATLPKSLDSFGSLSLSSTIVSITSNLNAESHDNASRSISDRLIQWSLIVPTKLRLAALTSLFLNLKKHLNYLELSLGQIDKAAGPLRIVLFVSTCDSVDFLFYLLSSLKMTEKKRDYSLSNESWNEVLGLKLFRLHGLRDAFQRTQTFQSFKNESIDCAQVANVLITTNIGARGLDFPSVRLVVQWDAPFDPVEYTHKIGRTARYQSYGSSICFLMPHEKDVVLESLQAYKTEIEIRQFSPHLLLPGIDPSSSSKDLDIPFSSGTHKIITLIDKTIYNSQGHSVPVDSSKNYLLQQSQKAFLASLRGYATYPGALRQKGLHPKFLHLGHYAKSFGLRETPAKLGSISRQFSSKADKSDKSIVTRKRFKDMASRANLRSEFSSGI